MQTQEPSKLNLGVDLDFYDSDFGNEASASLADSGIKFVINKNHSINMGYRSLIWGKADQINPMNVWTADDMSYFFVESYEERKLNRPMAIYDYKQGDHHLQVVTAPRNINRYFSFPDSDSPWCYVDCIISSPSFLQQTASGLGVTAVFESTDSNDRLKDWEYGARFSSRVSGLDYSVMIHDGFERILIYERTIVNPTLYLYSEDRHRVTSIGGDLAFSVAGFGVRAEARQIFGRPYIINVNAASFSTDSDGIQRINEAEAILSVDNTFFDKLYVNLQILTTWSQEDNSDVVIYEGRELVSLLARLPLFIEGLEVKYEMFVDTTYTDTFSNLEIQYKYNDELSFRTGVYLISASEKDPAEILPEGLLGGLQDNDTYYFRSMYEF